MGGHLIVATIQGYTRGKPNAQWWMEQIKNGELFRRQWASEDRWDLWNRYYRGNWRGDIYPVNLFFTLLRTIVPRVYFRNPSVSITPAKPGLLNLGFARVLERVDNKLMRRMGLKKQLKRMVQDAFLTGTAFAKTGFGGLYNPSPQLNENVRGTDISGHLVEYADFANPNMPWVRRSHPSTVVVPAGTGVYEEARWVAHKITRTAEDVRGDTRFENTSNLNTNTQFEISGGKFVKTEMTVTLYEVHDRKTGEVFVLAPDTRNHDPKYIFHGSDSLQLNGNLPTRPLIFNEDSEFMWGIPDARILEPFQDEMNESKTQIRAHRRSSTVKILALRKHMDEREAMKIVSDDVSPVVWIKGSRSVRDVMALVQGSTIPQELIQNQEVIRQDTREMMGFGRNQGGEFNSRSGDTTATEAQIVQAASEIRVDERRDIMADLLTELIEIIHEVIFTFWKQEQIIDVVGPGGVPLWVHFQGDLLRNGRYTVTVDPDSAVPQTRALREQKAAALYQMLKTNPLIDPVRLTQYLLHELHGVQFDDMMRVLPPAVGVDPNSVLGPAEFGQAVSGSMNRVASGQVDPRMQALEAPANAA